MSEITIDFIEYKIKQIESDKAKYIEQANAQIAAFDGALAALAGLLAEPASEPAGKQAEQAGNEAEKQDQSL